jgi:HTH-type transcriptional regulator, sugar sensing transcriptional regulator
MSEIKKILKGLDLSEKEVSVFISLVRLGIAPVSTIASDSGITRTHVYDILGRLQQHALVTETQERGVKKYEAITHDGLVAYITRRQKRLEQLREQLNRAASDYNALKVGVGQKTKVRFFDGPEGIKNIYAEIRADLQKTKEPFELLTIFSPALVEKVLPGWMKQEEYIDVGDKMTKRGILYDSALSDKLIALMEESKNKHVYKKWPGTYGAFPTDTIAWGNKITYIDLVEYPSGIIIENASAVHTFKIWFDFMWDKLK